MVTLILNTMSRDGTFRPVFLGKKEAKEVPNVGDTINGRSVIGVKIEDDIEVDLY